MPAQTVTPPVAHRLPVENADHVIALLSGKWDFKPVNPENISTGYSGFLLLLIEFYEQSKEEKYLRPIKNAIEKLVTYCRENDTVNYSLYTGRAGVAYVLIRWYMITKDKGLLDHAIEIMTPADKEYLHSRYTTNYLFDGRAGTLLVIMQLYLIAKENFLLKYIELFAHKIICDSVLGKEGIHWTSEEEINEKPSCSVANGTAGIKYVLSLLNKYLRNSDLQFIIAEIDRYQENCTPAPEHNGSTAEIKMLPFVHPRNEERAGIDIPINSTEIKKSWLARYYPRTLHLLDKLVPGILVDYLQMPTHNITEELIRFGHFTRSINVPGAGAAAKACFMDLYELEKEKTNYFLTHNTSPYEVMTQELARHKEVLANLNKPGDWLLEQKLLISPDVRVLSSRWDWSFKNDFFEIKETMTENFKTSPANFEYIIQVARRAELVEFPLSMDTSLLLNQFRQPKLVRQAMLEIKQYVHSLPGSLLQQMIFPITGNSDVQHFLAQLDNLALFRIRQWLYRGILLVA
jgi:hypothetical protein